MELFSRCLHVPRWSESNARSVSDRLSGVKGWTSSKPGLETLGHNLVGTYGENGIVVGCGIAYSAPGRLAWLQRTSPELPKDMRDGQQLLSLCVVMVQSRRDTCDSVLITHDSSSSAATRLHDHRKQRHEDERRLQFHRAYERPHVRTIARRRECEERIIEPRVAKGRNESLERADRIP